MGRYDIYTGVETWASPSGMLTTGNTNGVTSDDDFIEPITTFSANRKGRYIRIQLSGSNALHVTEVQVFN